MAKDQVKRDLVIQSLMVAESVEQALSLAMVSERDLRCYLKDRQFKKELARNWKMKIKREKELSDPN